MINLLLAESHVIVPGPLINFNGELLTSFLNLTVMFSEIFLCCIPSWSDKKILNAPLCCDFDFCKESVRFLHPC